jgi:uncharacterized protein (DUF58 family)
MLSAVSLHLPELVALQQQARMLRLRPTRQAAAFSGAHRSRVRGRGMEFDEVRHYQVGDDISTLDWKVTARKGSPHIKLFREERERPLLLCLDYRPSMMFATRGRLKAVQASYLAALIAWAGIARGDRLGGLIFSRNGHQELRPARGKKAVLQWLYRCCEADVWSQARQTMGEQDDKLFLSLLRLRRLAHPGTTVAIISDFRALDRRCQQQLQLLARHCECLLCHVFDPLERQLPDQRQYRVHDGHDAFVMDGSDDRLRQQVNQHFSTLSEQLTALCRHERLHLLSLETRDDPLTALKNSGWWQA